MKIKELIETGSIPTDAHQQKHILKSSDSMYHALNQFIKSKSVYLTVQENNELVGVLSLVKLASAIAKEYDAEREKRYVLIRTLNNLLTKLNHLTDIISATKIDKETHQVFKDTFEKMIKTLNAQ